MSKVMSKYIPTTHAIERARIRFGITSEAVTEWINAMMQDAKLITTNVNKSLVYEAEDVRIIIDGRTNAVITLHHALRTDFLRPALEREIRKLKRESTRRIRMTERNLAEAYAELAERMMNFANARNPQTRKLIEGRIESIQADISDLERHIERLKDEVKAKIRAIELITE